MRKIAIILISIALIACFFLASRANNSSGSLRRKSYQKTSTFSRMSRRQPDGLDWKAFVDACKKLVGTTACGYRDDFPAMPEFDKNPNPYFIECCKGKCEDYSKGWGQWRNKCKQNELQRVTILINKFSKIVLYIFIVELYSVH
jgi:hypothetical protein